jgi:hypothetical protein
MQQRVSMAGVGAGARQTWNFFANTRYKIAALVVWGVAVITTQQFLAPLLHQRGMDGVTIWLSAIGLQLVLTIVESEFWQGERGQVSGAAVLVDTLINAAGLFPFIGGLGLTNVWAMISKVTGASTDLNAITIGVISLFLGYILAATPERVWR